MITKKQLKTMRRRYLLLVHRFVNEVLTDEEHAEMNELQNTLCQYSHLLPN